MDQVNGFQVGFDDKGENGSPAGLDDRDGQTEAENDLSEPVHSPAVCDAGGSGQA